MPNQYDEINRPKLIVVSESAVQRLAFTEAVKACGYDLVDSVSSERLDAVINKPVDLWLIDCEDDIQIIQKLQDNHKYLLGFTPSPPITNLKAFNKWQRHLKRKLLQVFDGAIFEPIKQQNSYQWVRRDWHLLLILGASMGGPAAVKQFLDYLPSDLPISIVLAQHASSQAVQSLPDILTRHNEWDAKVLDAKQNLSAGKVWILPTKNMISFNRLGWLQIEDSLNTKHYKPSISDAMLNATNAFGDKVLNIIFSGMGDDGSDVAIEVCNKGGSIWVQSLETCECDSQPKEMIATKQVNYIATPKKLAEQVAEMVKTMQPLKHL